MRRSKMMVLVPVAMLAAACGRNSSSSADDALKNDLALASQAQPYNPQQFVSPAEATLAQPQNAPQNLQAVARQPVYRAPARTTTRRASTSRSSGSSGGYYPAAP